MDNDKKINLPAEIIGWYGMGAIVLAYVLVSFEMVAAESYAYQLLNLSGAVGVVVISWVKKARQPLVLNVFWASIATFAIVSLLFR